MSELAKQIRAFQTNTKYVQTEPFMFSHHEYTDRKIEQVVEYSMVARIGYTVLVPENNAEALAYAKNKVATSVNHAVFGEFREPLLELLRDPRVYNNLELRSRVEKIYNQMFVLE